MMYKTEPLLPNTIQGWTLDSTIEEMLGSQPDESGKTSRTLVKSEDMTVVLTVLPKGQELKEHQVSASVMVIALRGEAVFRCAEVSNTLAADAGGMLAMGKNQPHSVQALSDSAFLLVMGRQDHA